MNALLQELRSMDFFQLFCTILLLVACVGIVITNIFMALALMRLEKRKGGSKPNESS